MLNNEFKLKLLGKAINAEMVARGYDTRAMVTDLGLIINQREDLEKENIPFLTIIVREADNYKNTCQEMFENLSALSPIETMKYVNALWEAKSHYENILRLYLK